MTSPKSLDLGFCLDLALIGKADVRLHRHALSSPFSPGSSSWESANTWRTSHRRSSNLPLGNDLPRRDRLQHPTIRPIHRRTPTLKARKKTLTDFRESTVRIRLSSRISRSRDHLVIIASSVSGQLSQLAQICTSYLFPLYMA
jgi:hypothetical protein